MIMNTNKLGIVAAFSSAVALAILFGKHMVKLYGGEKKIP